MKKKLSVSNFENSSIDTNSVLGGIGGPAKEKFNIGIVTRKVPPSGKPEDATIGNRYDEGCPGSIYESTHK